MPGVYKLEGLVLRKRPLGEADVAVTVLSPTHGKLDAAARGARRSSTARGGKLEPFSHVRLMIARGRSLDVISQVELVHAWRSILEDLDRIASATYILELFDALVEDGPSPSAARIFGCLTRSLDEVSEAQCVSLDLICRRAELRLLIVLGFVPELDVCVRCGGAPTHFLVEEGGGLCPACLDGASPADEGRVLPLHPSARRLFGLLRTPGLRHLAESEVGRDAAAAVERILRAHIEWHWPTRFRSRRFLDQARSVGDGR